MNSSSPSIPLFVLITTQYFLPLKVMLPNIWRLLWMLPSSGSFIPICRMHILHHVIARFGWDNRDWNIIFHYIAWQLHSEGRVVQPAYRIMYSPIISPRENRLCRWDLPSGISCMTYRAEIRDRMSEIGSVFIVTTHLWLHNHSFIWQTLDESHTKCFSG